MRGGALLFRRCALLVAKNVYLSPSHPPLPSPLSFPLLPLLLLPPFLPPPPSLSPSLLPPHEVLILAPLFMYM